MSAYDVYIKRRNGRDDGFEEIIVPAADFSSILSLKKSKGVTILPAPAAGIPGASPFTPLPNDPVTGKVLPATSTGTTTGTTTVPGNTGSTFKFDNVNVDPVNKVPPTKEVPALPPRTTAPFNRPVVPPATKLK